MKVGDSPGNGYGSLPWRGTVGPLDTSFRFRAPGLSDCAVLAAGERGAVALRDPLSEAAPSRAV